MLNLLEIKKKYEIEPIKFNLADLEIKHDIKYEIEPIKFNLAGLKFDKAEEFARFQSDAIERNARLYPMPNIVSDLLREFDLNRPVYNWDDGTSDSYHQSNELHELAKSTEISDLNKMEEILKLKKESFIKKANAFTNVLMMNAPNYIGQTPLYVAILNQNSPATRLLSAYGADLFFEDEDKNKIVDKKIGSSNVSCLDLFKADENEMVKYVRNHETRDILKGFPISSSEAKVIRNFLENKFDEGIKRKGLIDKMNEHCKLYDKKNLPEEMNEEIASYLSNADLENLKDAVNNNRNAQPSTKMDETREEQGIIGNGRKV